MDTKIKNTLFRFVTLRKPEQIDDEKKSRFFVHHPDAESSILYASNVDTFADNLTSFESTPPGALKDADTLKNVSPGLYKFSQWLLQNRSSATSGDLIQKRTEFAPSELTSMEEMNIWDNLIYQIFRKKSTRARSVAITMLYGNYILKNAFVDSGTSTFTTIESDSFKRTLQARVTIPEYVLFRNPTTGHAQNYRTASSSDRISVETQRQINKSIQQLNDQLFIEDLQKLSRELLSYRKKYNKAEALNRKDYNTRHKRLVDEYNENNPLKYTADDPEPGLPVTTPRAAEPEYDYTPLDEVDVQELQKWISPESYELFLELGAGEATTQDEVKSIIQKKFTELSNNIFDNTKLSRKYNVYKGVILPQSSSNVHSVVSFGCSPRYRLRKLRINLSMNFGNADTKIIQIDYKLLRDGDVVGQSNIATFTANTNGVIGVGLFSNGLRMSNDELDNLTIEATFRTNQEDIYELSHAIHVDVDTKGQATVISAHGGTMNESLEEKYGITRLGIADYKKVEQSICCYEPGEVSHIENVMAKEYKEKATKRLRRSETTVTTEQSTETENLTDTTSTERNEMHQEIAKMKQDSINLNASVGLRRKGKWEVDLNASFAYANSREESDNMARSEAKELTERAMERVVTKVREERINKIIDEYTEENKHGYDNRDGSQHVSGVYRWVDKIYKNQIINYGKRVMYEFMIPEPAFLHMKFLTDVANENLEKLEKPLDPRENGLATSVDVTESTFEKWASAYNAEVAAAPKANIYIGKAYSGGATDGKGAGSTTKESNDMIIPEGYMIQTVKCSFEHKRKTGSGTLDRNTHTRSYVQVGNRSTRIGLISTNSSEGDFAHGYSANPREFTLESTDIEPILTIDQYSIPVSVVTWDVSSFSLNVNAVLGRTGEHYKKWQLETFNAIIQAYEDKLAIYESKVAEMQGVEKQFKETNPLFYRDIEELVLKKNCISYMLNASQMGVDFQKNNTMKEHYIDQSPALETYASRAKFIEQAFEWEIMSYIFYPFYWGSKERWSSLYGQETSDILYTKFLQSGMARVIVSIRPGFEDAVTWFMATGEVWNGDCSAPIINDDLYLSIVEELQEPEGKPEGDPWYTRIPSTLTVIQSGSIGLKAEGLPCSCQKEYIESIEQTDAKLVGKDESGTDSGTNEGVGYWEVNPDQSGQTPPIVEIPDNNASK